MAEYACRGEMVLEDAACKIAGKMLEAERPFRRGSGAVALELRRVDLELIRKFRCIGEPL